MDIKLLNQVEKESIGERQPLPENYLRLSDDEMDARIAAAKHTLGERLVILGHHYQRDEVIKFADFTGDSLKLARAAASKGKAEFIVFCGVHFMAESADILCAPHQKVVLPDLAAGLLDGRHGRRRSARHLLARAEGDGRRRRCGDGAGVIPVTYINSSADIKAFCGEHGGIVCTSTNARGDHGAGRGSAARSWSCCPTSISAATPRSRWASRSTRWSCGIRTKSGAASSRSR